MYSTQKSGGGADNTAAGADGEATVVVVGVVVVAAEVEQGAVKCGARSRRDPRGDRSNQVPAALHEMPLDITSS